MKNPVRYAIGTMSLRVLRRLCVSIAVTSVLILGAAAPANAAAKALPASVLIKNEATGLCLDDTSPGRVRVIEAKCGAAGHFQHWRVYVHSGYVKIRLSINLAFCLNGVVGTGGVTIKLCRSNDLNQNWFDKPSSVSGVFRILENSANDKCLDGSLQFGVRVANCISTDTHQLWI